MKTCVRSLPVKPFFFNEVEGTDHLRLLIGIFPETEKTPRHKVEEKGVTLQPKAEAHKPRF